MPKQTRNPALRENVRNLRQNMTLAEQRIWHHLRDKRLNGVKFRRQQTIGSYIVDFVSMAHHVVVELDGGQHAMQQTYDEQRTRFLNEQGYRVLRFWNDDVLQHTDAVLTEILRACSEAPPP